MVVDTHTHAWGPPSPEHPWTNAAIVADVDGFTVDTIYTADKLLADMDQAGVDRAVVVGYPIGDYRDNTYTLTCVREHDRLDGIVMIDPLDEDAPAQIRDCMAVDGIHGVRLAPICPYDRMWQTFDPSVTWLRDAIDETAVWEALCETDAVLQLLIDTTQLDQALALAEAYPDLRFLFDHFGHADPTLAPDDDPFADFAAFTEYDAAVKVSEIAHHSNEPYPHADLHDHVRWFLEQFGRERVIWGSDYPNVSDVTGYAESRTWLEHVDGLSTADREWLTGRAARTFLGC
jgi:predicted TIM-barrel fold metal-dependent hydrolase